MMGACATPCGRAQPANGPQQQRPQGDEPAHRTPPAPRKALIEALCQRGSDSLLQGVQHLLGEQLATALAQLIEEPPGLRSSGTLRQAGLYLLVQERNEPLGVCPALRRRLPGTVQRLQHAFPQ